MCAGCLFPVVVPEAEAVHKEDLQASLNDKQCFKTGVYPGFPIWMMDVPPESHRRPVNDKQVEVYYRMFGRGAIPTKVCKVVWNNINYASVAASSNFVLTLKVTSDVCVVYVCVQPPHPPLRLR